MAEAISNIISKALPKDRERKDALSKAKPLVQASTSKYRAVSGTASSSQSTFQKAQGFSLIETEEGMKDAITVLRNTTQDEPNLAVDGEGVNYSRKGTLSILAIATRDHVYLFDILKLGSLVFDRGLREILEDSSRPKLLFDCREDSDILWHKHNVKLAGVLDVQIQQVIYSGRDDYTYLPTEQQGREHGVTTGCQRIWGLSKCLETYTNDKTAMMKKAAGTRHSKHRFLWDRRPLPKEAIDYACVDVSALFVLHEKMKMSTSLDESRLKIASEHYVDLKRSKIVRRYDDYEKNPYLPLNVIPPKGHATFPRPDYSVECVGCQRSFEKAEFANKHIRNGIQMCRICRKVKKDNEMKNQKFNRYNGYTGNYYV